jgi:ParB-like chromosome segregation protein Spo0J
MIKCYFLDVKSIVSDVPRSNFTESSLEKIANSILEADGLICPLIVQEIGVNKYTVIDGHQGYHAAVLAKQKNIQKAEMVNAFIIADNTRSAAIEQLNLLKQSPTNTVATPTIDRHILTEVLSSTIDRLLPAISAAISTQLEPIHKQLDEQKQILDTIKLPEKFKTEERTTTVKDTENLSVTIEHYPQPDPESDKQVKVSKTDSKKKNKSKDSLPIDTIIVADSNPPTSQDSKLVKTPKIPAKSRKKSKSEDALPSPILESTESSQQPDIIVAISAQITKPVESTKASNLSGSIDLDKSNNALNLINTLDPAQLKIKLERSGAATAKTVVKLVEVIVTNRSIQPEQKFESWDTIIDAKITGFGAVVIKKIIDKLK